jgi:hypothetical protein
MRISNLWPTEVDLETIIRLPGFKGLNAGVVQGDGSVARLCFVAPLRPGLVTHLMRLTSTQQSGFRPLSALL